MRKKYYCNDQEYGVDVLSGTRASYLTRVTQQLQGKNSLPKCIQAVQERFNLGGVQFVRKGKAASTVGGGVGRCSETGSILVITGRISAKFPANLPIAEVRRAIDSAGLTINHQFLHTRNCFDLRAPIGADVFEISRVLLRDWKCKYATPVFIEEFHQRTTTPTDPNFSQQWFLEKVGAQTAWDSVTGTGTRLAIIDWGFHLKNADLSTAISRTGTFVETAAHLPATFFAEANRIPQDSHGTSAAGMAIARANNAKFGCGLAHDASWIPIVALSGGIGTQQSLARAIAYAVDQRTEQPTATEASGADAISISIFPGRQSVVDSTLSDALDFAARKGRDGKGTVVFYAVENSNVPISNDAIASDPRVVAVGSSDRTDRRTSSAMGEALDLLAPGKDLRTVRSTSSFNSVSGTSFATPLVAAAAALIIQARPRITAEALIALLRNTCDKVIPEAGVTYDVNGHNLRYGYGRLNVAEAVRQAMLP